MEAYLDEAAAEAAPWPADARHFGDRRRVCGAHAIGVEPRSGIERQVQPAQRDQRRERGIDDEVGRTVERQEHVFLVLVDLPEHPAAARGGRDPESDRRHDGGCAQQGDPEDRTTCRSRRHSSNDILDFLAAFPPCSNPMSTPARLFLIDGSSQMYRAYHAMRGGGLTGPGGKSTHAVYIFVTMLRKLIADHAPQYHRRLVRPAGTDVPFRDGHRLQGEPLAHAAGSRRADSLGARSVRGARRAHPDFRTLRGRRRDRDAGREGGRRRVRGRDRDRRQGLLPARARRHQGLQPARKTVRGSTPRASKRSSA